MRVLIADAWPAGFPPHRLGARAVAASVAGLVRAGSVDASLLADATRERIARALDEAVPRFDLLHFVGQGIYHESLPVHALLLESSDGLDELQLDELVALGRQHGLVTLLLTVEGAPGTRQPQRERFSGEVTGGAPAVIDVALGQADGAATAFLHALYRALAEGLPLRQGLGEAARSASGGRRTRALLHLLRRRLSRTLATAIAALALAGTLVGLYRDLLPWFDSPKQARMNGAFKLAVADFGDPDALLATRVTKILQTALPDTQVWGPALTHAVQDAHGAEERADRINADVLVYGRLDVTARITTLVPEVYVRSESSLAGDSVAGVDAAGQYFLGSAISERGPPDNSATVEHLGRTFAQHAQAVTNFFLGLSEYTAGHLHEADEKLGTAQSSWKFDGAELVYLFRGNIALQRAVKIAQSGARAVLLEEAAAFYQSARHANPDYARADLGFGEARFQLARGDCDSPESAGGLYAARAAFERAARASAPPPFANVPAKAAFGLGKVALCLSQAGIENSWHAAEQHLRRVVSLTDAGDERLRDLAAEAHADLGLLFLLNPADVDGRYERADAEYDAAIGLTPQADRKALFASQRGFIAEKLGRRKRAASFYRQALELAPADRARYERAICHVQPEDVSCGS